MMHPDEDDPQVAYEQSSAVLLRMMDGRDQHVIHVPNCGAAPLCMGPAAGVELMMIGAGNPGMIGELVMTAVGELCRLRTELGIALAWKIDLTMQMERSGEAHEQELRELRAQNKSLRAIVGELQRKVSGS